ncbi:DNA-binding protein [Paracidovorax anthurii]|uniref:DNA-binding protein n=1 Tax=Paracidovorax anthurii TaxID=78229 RepID=UPI000DCFD761|nr:DNA-binding protein [Paracidovorax anthurii]
MSTAHLVIQPGAAASFPDHDHKSLLTEEGARAMFKAKGVTVAEWARARGFSVELTRMVLAGKRKCLRGQSHQIAVALGIKPGVE